jgi:uncharacterized protein (TIGR03437 family)
MHLKIAPALVVFLSSITQALAQPAIQATLNGASYTTDLAPGSVAAVFGTQLAPGIASASGTPLPLQLGGVSVTVNGVPCPLAYISPGQINLVIPFQVTTLNGSQTVTVPVVVTTPAGASAPFNVKLTRTAPALFAQDGTGRGDALVLDGNFHPASAIGSDPIILYATGLGPTDPPGSADSGGAGSEPLNRVVDAVNVLVGDSPAQVLFAGLAPGLPGVYQINVIPQGAISNHLTLIVNHRQSNTLTLAIPVGTNVKNVSASIRSMGSGELIYSSPGRLVTFSEILFGAGFTLSFDFLPGAKPFQLVARYSGGADVIQEVIHIDPGAGS